MMKQYWRYFLPLLVFMGLVVFFMIGLKLDPHEVPSPLINKPAPVFNLPTLANTSQSLSPKEMLGKVWLLNVWASWCGACREEHPVLMEIARQNAVPLYGMDYKDNPQDAQSVLAQAGNPYQAVLLDIDGRVGIDYGVYGVPETYVIDKTGIIRYKQIGPITEEVWANKIMPMLRSLQ